MFGNHLLETRSLMEIKRYQNKFKHKERSVAEHSWFVSKISHGLALWEKYKFFNEEVDIEKILFLAINHDIVEGYTGDILSTTKNLSPLLKSELDKVEEIIFNETILGTIPNSWGNSYLEVHQEMSEVVSVNSKIVKAGDLIDRMFECMEEIELGNIKDFDRIMSRDIEKLYEFNLKSVNYFLKYSSKDIGAYDYIPVVIQKKLENIDFRPYF